MRSVKREASLLKLMQELLNLLNKIGYFLTLCRLIQCVPQKRKPVLSVRYLFCHAILKPTICFIIKSIFSSFI